MTRYYNSSALNKAKKLRKNQTDTEGILWAKLRNRLLNGIKFRRQVPIGKYIVDFLCLDKKLVIELDGFQHLTEENVVRDNERTEFLCSLGYKVIRIYNNDISLRLKNVLEYIFDEYEKL